MKIPEGREPGLVAGKPVPWEGLGMESPAWDGEEGEEWGSGRTINLVFPVMEQSPGPTLPTTSRNPVYHQASSEQ